MTVYTITLEFQPCNKIWDNTVRKVNAQCTILEKNHRIQHNTTTTKLPFYQINLTMG